MKGLLAAAALLASEPALAQSATANPATANQLAGLESQVSNLSQEEVLNSDLLVILDFCADNDPNYFDFWDKYADRMDKIVRYPSDGGIYVLVKVESIGLELVPDSKQVQKVKWQDPSLQIPECHSSDLYFPATIEGKKSLIVTMGGTELCTQDFVRVGAESGQPPSSAPSQSVSEQTLLSKTRVGVALGADVEELGEYNAGNAGMAKVYLATAPLKYDRLGVGLEAQGVFGGSNLVNGENRIGLERLGLSLSEEVLRTSSVDALVAMNGGMSFDPNFASLDKVPYVGLGVQSDFKDRFVCGVDLHRDFYANGEPFGPYVHLDAYCGVQREGFSGKGLERSPLPSRSVPLPDSPTLTVRELTQPFSLFVVPALPTAKGEPEPVIKGEYDRIRPELQSNVQDGIWVNAERFYQELFALQKDGVILSYDVFYWGAETARALGDVAETYRRLSYAKQVNPTQAVLDWMNYIETNYGKVEIKVSQKWQGKVELTWEVTIERDKTYAFELAKKSVSENGYFEGYLPVGSYTIAGQSLEVKAGELVEIRVKD